MEKRILKAEAIQPHLRLKDKSKFESVHQESGFFCISFGGFRMKLPNKGDHPSFVPTPTHKLTFP